MTTIREAAFGLLRRHGMTTVFGNPGSNELLFLKDFPSDFRYILGLHEGAVMAMADGYAQASGQAPLVTLHSAAGTGGSMGVLSNTIYSKSPVVVLSGQQVRDTVGQEVMASSPAIMRSVVVLPQPEGPTKTMNSLSRISRFTSFTAWTSSKRLLRLRITTWAMAGYPFTEPVRPAT